MTDTTQTAPGAAPEVTNPTPTTANPIVPALLPVPGAAQEVTGQPGTVVEPRSRYDTVDTCEPKLKKGVHHPLCKILDFAPSLNRESQDFQGWSVTLALAEDAPNEYGGVIPTGTRLGMFTIFTLPSQYRDADACDKLVKRSLMGLNNIIRDRKTDPSDARAKAAFLALPATQKLPEGDDVDPSHYEQWKGTIIRASLSSKENKEGEVQVNCNGFLAKDTPAATK